MYGGGSDQISLFNFIRIRNFFINFIKFNFLDCSQNESGLSFTTADNPSNHFAYGDNARYACHSPHGIIFVKPPGQSEYIETNAGSATCGSRATWEFNNPTKCWNGKFLGSRIICLNMFNKLKS